MSSVAGSTRYSMYGGGGGGPLLLLLLLMSSVAGSTRYSVYGGGGGGPLLLSMLLSCVAGSARYSVYSGAGGGPFIVSSLSGHLLTAGHLDHENISSYLLTIRAELITDRSLFTLTQVSSIITCSALPERCQFNSCILNEI